mgnify:CR=1 FL=1
MESIKLYALRLKILILLATIRMKLSVARSIRSEVLSHCNIKRKTSYFQYILDKKRISILIYASFFVRNKSVANISALKSKIARI